MRREIYPAVKRLEECADVLHVAILEQINPDLFVTGDQNQAALATARRSNYVFFA